MPARRAFTGNLSMCWVSVVRVLARASHRLRNFRGYRDYSYRTHFSLLIREWCSASSLLHNLNECVLQNYPLLAFEFRVLRAWEFSSGFIHCAGKLDARQKAVRYRRPIRQIEAIKI